MARRKVTSYDVARKAGVSRTTVSFVLNNVPGARISEETRRRVLKAARELGYFPNAAARSLVSQKTRTIGLVLCQTPDQVFHDAFLPEVLHGISDVMRPAGYRVLVEPVEDVTRPNAYIDLVLEQRIDGLILSGPRSDDAELPQLKEEGFPVILLGQLPGAGFPSVDVDNVEGARIAVEHLISLGHTRIGIITNAPPQYTGSAHRLEGYRLALAAHGIPFDENLVCYGNFTEGSGYRAMNELLGLANPPTAVFVASDLVAFGVLAAIRDRGLLVPRDIAVVGFDDVRMARYVTPPLTTVRLPAYELGQTAAQILVNWLEKGKEPPKLTLLPTELVIRKSCGAIRPQEFLPISG
ncbi:MAG: LacI family transcriptional regulator [Chloroflexi bacterium]|nr:MAG: LacI family transcriptional regulator [Chloroflexota bacterium]HDN79776.1 LacI family transcriptional regulator [Chloroflexota bacterium]